MLNFRESFDDPDGHHTIEINRAIELASQIGKSSARQDFKAVREINEELGSLLKGDIGQFRLKVETKEFW